jgi:hypothetical protein
MTAPKNKPNTSQAPKPKALDPLTPAKVLDGGPPPKGAIVTFPEVNEKLAEVIES